MTYMDICIFSHTTEITVPKYTIMHTTIIYLFNQFIVAVKIDKKIIIIVLYIYTVD